MPDQENFNPLLLQRFARGQRHLGTFRIVTENGKQRFYVGTRGFDNPSQALEFSAKTNLKSWHTITHGAALRDMPGVGPGYFGNLEGLARLLADEDPNLRGASIERISFAVDKNTTRNVINEFTSGGVFQGFLHPTAENLNMLRIRTASGDYLNERQITDALSKIIHFTGNEQKYDKLYKRLNQFFNMEEFGDFLPGGKKVGVRLFSPVDMARSVHGSKVSLSAAAAEYGYDGITHISGELLDDLAEKIESRAREMVGQISPGDMSVSAVDARAQANAYRDRAKSLRKMARKGGRMKDFRILGLSGPDGGSVRSSTGEVLDPGMIKGDVFVHSRKSWRRFLSKGFGLTDEQIAGTHVLTADTNYKTELGLLDRPGKDVSSYLTLKKLDYQNFVRLDVQTHAAFPNLVTPRQMADFTARIYEDEIRRFQTTGKISARYRKVLTDIIEREAPEDGDNILSLIERQRKARAALAAVDSGNVSPEMFREILSGITRGIPHHKYASAAAFYIPGAVGHHIVGLDAAAQAGFRYLDLAEDEIVFSKRHGFVMSSQTAANIKHLTGGSDFDDLLRGHLRYIEQTGEFKMIGIRAPTTHGESILMDVDIRKNFDLIEALGQADPRYSDEVRELAKQRRVLERIQRYEAQANQARNLLDDIERNINTHKASSDLKQRANRAELDRLVRQRRNVSKRLTRFNNRIATAVAATSVDLPTIESRMIDLAKNLAIHVSDPSELAEYGDYLTVAANMSKTGLDARMPKKHTAQQAYENWVAMKGGAAFEAEMLKGKNVVNEAAQLAAEFSQIGSVHNKRALIRAIINEQVKLKGGIGSVVNIDMLVNSILPQLEGVSGAEGIIPYEHMENLVDQLIQGVTEGGDFSFVDVMKRKYGMIEGIATAIVNHDVKLPSYFWDLENKNHPGKYSMRAIEGDLRVAIERIDPNYFDNRTFQDLIGPSEIFDDAGNEFRYLYDDIAAMAAQVERSAYDEIPQMKFAFTLREEEAAEKLYSMYRATLQHYSKIGSQAYDESPEMMALIGRMGSDIDPNREAARVLRRELGSFIEDGRLSDEGTRIFGSLLQKYRWEMFSSLNAGPLSDIVAHSDAVFAGLTGERTRLTSRIAEETDSELANELRQQLQNQIDIEQRGILADDLVEGAADVLDSDLEMTLNAIRSQPGYRRNRMREASFGRAADVISPRAGIFQDFNWSQVRALWDDAPLFKRGVIGAAALVGFSAVYSKFRDRSPEDMQGPPLLPGGSAYEQLPRDTPYPPLTPMPTSQGGVTYKVIADGSYDPGQLQRSIGNILGDVPMVGHFYNTQPDRIPRPRFNQPRSNDELFGGI